MSGRGGGMCGGGRVWQMGGVRGRREGHCSRLYTSYSNAFLFDLAFYFLKKKGICTHCDVKRIDVTFQMFPAIHFLPHFSL